MKIEDLKKTDNWAKAPTQGQMLIYTSNRVLYEFYDNLEAIETDEKIKNENVLEIHLFDDRKEFRAVNTESKRFENGFIDCVISSKEAPDPDEEQSNGIDILHTYIEKMFVDANSKKKINVINCIKYDENTGMSYINNYRISRGK